jgi:hypothetical protein
VTPQPYKLMLSNHVAAYNALTSFNGFEANSIDLIVFDVIGGMTEIKLVAAKILVTRVPPRHGIDVIL